MILCEMRPVLCLLIFVYFTSAQYGDLDQDFGYVTVRDGAHMFYWLFYTTDSVESYTERPLVIWLQGGPGGSSVGYGNFEILGPWDLNLEPRNYSWVKEFNLLLIDNPVGTGFSYVEDLSLLTRNNEEIGADLVTFMRYFYQQHSEFETVPLYIYGQSYGGKMAVEFALQLNEAINEGTIRSNLQGIAMGNSWIHPVYSTLTWAPLLLAAGLIDDDGFKAIDASANLAKEYYEAGEYVLSTYQWAATQYATFTHTGNIDFYDITNKVSYSSDRKISKNNSLEFAIDLVQNKKTYTKTSLTREYDTDYIMNEIIKPVLNIPDHVTYGGQSNAVFTYQNGDFMLPVTDGIERLLNETNILVVKYNGNLDLICDTPGQLLWLDELKWSGANEFKASPRLPIWINNRLEGYFKSYGNFKFYWINNAGHSVPRDNPYGTSAFLYDMTGYGSSLLP